MIVKLLSRPYARSQLIHNMWLFLKEPAQFLPGGSLCSGVWKTSYPQRAKLMGAATPGGGGGGPTISCHVIL